jgi:hypothetical protein
MVILPSRGTGLWHLTPILFRFILLFIVICCTGFYVQRIPDLHVVFLPCNSTGLPPPCCCVLDYLFINQLMFFPSLHFTHVSVLLCLAVTQVRIPFIMECLFLSLAALTTTLPSIQILATTPLADTILVRLFTGHTFPYISSILGLQAFSWILEPWGWDRKVVWNVSKKLPLLAA